MRSLESYYLSESLPEVVDALSDSNLDPQRDREDVNVLTMNLAIKFLAEYLEVAEQGIEAIRSKVEASIERTPELNALFAMDTLISSMGMPSLPGNDSDFFGLESAVDVRATAAVLKEIIFNTRFELDRRIPFFAADLGSGTGVLLLASSIAARRAGFEAFMGSAFERSAQAVSRSRRALGNVLDEKTFRVVNMDILNPKLWEFYNDFPLHFWISETIAFITPGLKIEGDQVHRLHRHTQDTVHDPFPHVLENTIQSRPSFVDDVKDGRTAMFPDFINGLYRPAMDDSQLQLLHAPGQPVVRLDHVGSEFADFEDLTGKSHRWEFYDDKSNPLIDLFESLQRHVSQSRSPGFSPLSASEIAAKKAARAAARKAAKRRKGKRR